MASRYLRTSAGDWGYQGGARVNGEHNGAGVQEGWAAQQLACHFQNTFSIKQHVLIAVPVLTRVKAVGVVGVVGLRLAVGAVAGHAHHHRLALAVAHYQGAACIEKMGPRVETMAG